MRACDAWPEGVEVFRALGFQIKCDLIDELARDLPYEDKSFEFVCAFSVLTHLPDYAAKAVMTALHRVLASDGVIAITVRPKSYWALFNDGEMVRQHEERGFAYRPHNGRAIFGDNSMSLGHIENNWSAWQIVSTQVNTTTRISA